SGVRPVSMIREIAIWPPSWSVRRRLYSGLFRSRLRFRSVRVVSGESSDERSGNIRELVPSKPSDARLSFPAILRLGQRLATPHARPGVAQLASARPVHDGDAGSNPALGAHGQNEGPPGGGPSHSSTRCAAVHSL